MRTLVVGIGALGEVVAARLAVVETVRAITRGEMAPDPSLLGRALRDSR
ncbi:MAG TPA: hypothetical protein VFR85_18260 [Anaeromyxobacteraceae bacterium]|nr:hypothetical protein [Anaeromyxobacteraceae bacterium]